MWCHWLWSWSLPCLLRLGSSGMTQPGDNNFQSCWSTAPSSNLSELHCRGKQCLHITQYITKTCKKRLWIILRNCSSTFPSSWVLSTCNIMIQDRGHSQGCLKLAKIAPLPCSYRDGGQCRRQLLLFSHHRSCKQTDLIANKQTILQKNSLAHIIDKVCAPFLFPLTNTLFICLFVFNLFSRHWMFLLAKDASFPASFDLSHLLTPTQVFWVPQIRPVPWTFQISSFFRTSKLLWFVWCRPEG